MKFKENEAGTYRYSLKSTGYSSDRYGKCEVCRKHSSEVFHQVEERKYDPNKAHIDDLLEDSAVYQKLDPGWTRNKCFDLWGHKECLISKRR